MSLRDFNEYVKRARAQHGDRLNLSDLPEKFRPYFRERIRVRSPWGGDRPEKNGVLSVTTGWKPFFYSHAPLRRIRFGLYRQREA